jgi:electron transfer flavoprotein beta subunit
VKILVTVKRVEDPEIKIKIKPDGTGIDASEMKYVVNPFDEIAVEEALRLREAHQGEVVVVCLGPADASQQIRTTLAMGADRGIHILAETATDSGQVAQALAKIAQEEKPDLVLLGKQAIDDDMGQVGVRLAELLNYSQGTCASKEVSLDSADEKAKKPAFELMDKQLELVREVDGGIETLRLSLPAVVTTELRLNVPRYASLPGIMKAKKKPIKEISLASMEGLADLQVQLLKMTSPSGRQAGVKVPDVATLVDKLRNEAKVI